MKRLKLFSSLSTLVVGLALLGVPPAQAEPVSIAKAAELSSHRIERLVILNRIDVGFQDHFKSIDIVPLPHSAPTDPSFQVTVSQYPAADGSQLKLQIIMDESGKTLSNPLVPGGSASVAAPVWPDRDPLTLIEAATHIVIGASAPIPPEMVPFNIGLTNLTLLQGPNAAGEMRAIVEFKSSLVSSTLRIFILPDGTYESYVLLP